MRVENNLVIFLLSIKNNIDVVLGSKMTLFQRRDQNLIGFSVEVDKKIACNVEIEITSALVSRHQN